jgi:predicted nuclease of restriction endonuclease-like (RecB) superfamily
MQQQHVVGTMVSDYDQSAAVRQSEYKELKDRSDVAMLRRTQFSNQQSKVRVPHQLKSFSDVRAGQLEQILVIKFLEYKGFYLSEIIEYQDSDECLIC